MIRLFFIFYSILITCVFGYIFAGSLLENQVQDWVKYDQESDYVGAFYLIEELHQTLDSNEFEDMVKGFPAESNIPLEIINLENLDIPAAGLDLLNQQKIYIEDADQQILYYKLKASDQVVHLGPMHTYEPLQEVSNIFENLLFLVLALPIFFLLLILNARFKLLDQAATQLGAGNFTIRVSEKGRHRIGNINKSFNLMAERIERLIKGHKSLTNAVAHELRTPVSRIRFQLDMLHEEQDQAKQREYMHGMSDDLNELSDLVDELLTYAKFDREEPALLMQKHSLDKSLKRVVNNLGFDNTVSLEYDDSWLLSSDTERLPFEPKHLERAIANLVSNALKHANTEVKIQVEIDDGQCFIYVDDDGQGIKEQSRHQIFEPFVRLDNSRTRSTGGYGLGLAIVKQISQWHRGSVYIEQSPLGGARFVFSWPYTNSKTHD